MAIYDDLLAEAITIKNNVNPSSNTANLVGGLLVEVVTALQQLAAATGMASRYAYTTTNPDGLTSVTIPKSVHNCGDNPVVQCYVNGALAQMDIANSAGDITVTWANASDVNLAKPLVVAFSFI